MVSANDNPVKNFMKETEKLMDPQLWHACASGMVQMPEVNSKVFYFPQGHAEHAQKSLDFGICGRIPPLILCRVSDVKYLADSETDEVYAKISLVPLGGGENDERFVEYKNWEKPNSFAKILTQSDANNGGGFSVPRYCAETIFPPLDYSADPPVQALFAKDVHGEVWKFRHIFRGTPRRHLLTTGWSSFVNRKMLVAGDSIVFVRKENGEIHVGIRRSSRRRRIGGRAPEAAFSRWHNLSYKDADEKFRQSDRTQICDESVTEAAVLAASGRAFEVVYYPLSGTPEFVVSASLVSDASRIKWYPGMRFKMPFETEDSSQISWYVGTVSSIEVEDPIHWPDSPWCLLQVAWDEPDLLQHLKRVSPWSVELVSDVSPFLQSRFSPPRKKLRGPQPPSLVGQLPAPSLFYNPVIPSGLLSRVSDNIPIGIQGARHVQSALSSKDLHFNKMNKGLFPFGGNVMASSENEENNVDCLLKMGNSSPNLKEKNNEQEIPAFMLFGKPIFTDQQMSGKTISNTLSNCNQEKTTNLSDNSESAVLQNGPLDNNSSDGVFPCYKYPKSELESSLCSSDELYKNLADVFGIATAEMLNVKHTRDEEFSEFMKRARRLTALTDPGSDNIGS